MDIYYSQYSPNELTLNDGIHLNEIGQYLLTVGVTKEILNLL